MPKNKMPAAILIAMLAASSSARAADATVGDLTQLQGQVLLKKAQVDLAKQEDELRKLNGGSAAGVPMGLSASGLGDAGTPSVRSVAGVNGRLYATFVYSSGITADAAAGETIPGGFKVVRVTVDKVELQKGGRRFQVGFASHAPSTLSNSGMNPGMGQPGYGVPQPMLPGLNP
ncbi:type IV pilus biogenesis protein PilP [Pseudomonas aeruginosa]|uniref:type IV pilus biogenesis protein PilP n=1 Tax=Pseudomonas aeruginosa TaxID=287 RepID=UPI00053E4429|nr:type IV pilus biogenesis protein PilP [Pseudomonas aeruginosa]HBO8820384.1 type IV pilus biogenesis protein PilP [Pseudomonas aeruginosa]HCF4747847.1 type IV pilus biogenesis protein PilP [Pseudomonas aeruginosa]HCF4767512.1 type IV pilus biogenesis protein PilP [Pseudomonas aeruginosa]HCF6282114.1 type IV pilus biogenesis protein PilP [Pseudomonas aeruginosa]HCF6289988.1 type IV pilus biogenesis protein PilP [Pseudomonas aeruginosa]